MSDDDNIERDESAAEADAGLLIALGAGGIGGFAAHEYFDVPPPLPPQTDLSGVERDIAALQKTVKAQTARHKTLETQIKTASARLGEDVSKLEVKWQADLADLDRKIEAIEIPVIPPATVNIAPDSESADTPAVDADNAATAQPLETIIDPRPELLAVVDDLRGRVDEDMTVMRARLDKLEATAEDEVVAPAAKTVPNDIEAFPAADILAALKRAETPAAPQNWFGKILKKHVSLKRTDHDEAAAVLTDIEAAVLIGDWDAALALSAGLPEPARSSTQEWIARARR